MFLGGSRRRIDLNRSAVRQCDRDPRENRTPHHESAHAGDLGIQADRSEYYPRTQHASIVVTRHAAWRIRIQLQQDAPDDFLRLPRRTGEGVHPRCLERDLVPHECELAARSCIELLEVAIQACDRRTAAAHGIEEAERVEAHLKPYWPSLPSTKPSPMQPSGPTPEHETSGRLARHDVAVVHQVSPTLRALKEGPVICRIAECIGKLGDREITRRIFQRPRHGPPRRRRDIAKPKVVRQAFSNRTPGRCRTGLRPAADHCGQGALSIEVSGAEGVACRTPPWCCHRRTCHRNR